jgi:hypothetical protein
MNDSHEYSSARLATIASRAMRGEKLTDEEIRAMAGSVLTQHNPRAAALREMLGRRDVAAGQLDALRKM